jgi:hypothetical protein
MLVEHMNHMINESANYEYQWLRTLIKLTFQTCSRTQLIVPLTVKLVSM